MGRYYALRRRGQSSRRCHRRAHRPGPGRAAHRAGQCHRRARRQARHARHLFAIDEKTGSERPLRAARAVLGVIRLILETKLRLPLLTISARRGDPSAELLDFFADRLTVALRDSVRHDLIAVFASATRTILVRLLARVEALGAFLRCNRGCANLLDVDRRALNIVRTRKARTRRATPMRLNPAPQGAGGNVLAEKLKSCKPRESGKALEAMKAGAMKRRWRVYACRWMNFSIK